MDPMGLFPAPLDSHEIVQAMEMNPLHSHDSKVHQWQFPKRHMGERKAVFFQVQLEKQQHVLWGLSQATISITLIHRVAKHLWRAVITHPRHPGEYLLKVWLVFDGYGLGPSIPHLRKCSPGCLGTVNEAGRKEENQRDPLSGVRLAFIIQQEAQHFFHGGASTTSRVYVPGTNLLPLKEGLFKSKQGTFGFQVCIYI